MKNSLLWVPVAIILIVLGIWFSVGHAGHSAGTVNATDPSITTFTRLSANDFINGGVEQIDSRLGSMTQASTTACSFTTPNATSTLDSVSALFTVGSTTASTVTIATTTSGGSASTTPLMAFALAANAQGTEVFEPTTTDKTVLAPNTGVIVTMAGGVGTFSPSGVCTVKTTVLN